MGRIIMVLDCSQSMEPHHKTLVDSFNDFLESQQNDYEDSEIQAAAEKNAKDPKKPKILLPPKYNFTLVQFSTGTTEKSYDDINNVQKLKMEDYKADGMTALYDALGGIMRQFENETGNILAVMTDGMDNCSKKYSVSSVREMIENYTDKKNWLFQFFGTNQEADKEIGHSLGIELWFLG